MSARSLRRGNWSVQEMARLRVLLPRRGVAATAGLLRRSPAAVARKALELLRVPMRHGDWTDSDDAQLRESWGAVEPRLLGPMLGRTPAEVLRRANELRAQLQTGPWRREEEQALKEWYGTRLDDDLEIALGRSRDEIAAAAQRLCLAKDKRLRPPAGARPAPAKAGGKSTVRRRMPRWSATEIERLRQLYPDHDNLEVARQLGRTVTSVANKAHQLALHKSPPLLARIGRENVRLRYDSNGSSAAGPGGQVGSGSQVGSGGLAERSLPAAAARPAAAE